MNKYANNSSKGCVLQVDFENSKELRELHNDYILVQDKIEIKREMLSDYQLKIADLYNIPISNVIKLKKNTSSIRIQSIAMVKTINRIQHTKRNRSGKKWRQKWKSVAQLNE